MTKELKAVQKVLKAARFASEKHANHRRRGVAAEPYVNHLIEVAELISMALVQPDTNLVVAALRHDTIEDTDTSKEELERFFGSDVADLVAEVTDDKSLPKLERKGLQIENAPKKSVRAQTHQAARQDIESSEHPSQPTRRLGFPTEEGILRVGQACSGRLRRTQPNPKSGI